jgi:hypothetical protein
MLGVCHISILPALKLYVEIRLGEDILEIFCVYI